MSETTFSYFGLKRGKTYERVQDPPGKFEYRLLKHYLSYRPLYNDEKEFRGVWNMEYYDEQKSSYREKPQA